MRTFYSYIALFGALIYLATLLPERVDRGPVEREVSDARMVVQDKVSRFDYALGATREITVTMTMSGRPSGGAETGVLQAVSYFTPEARDRFLARFGPGAPCPAPFYNRHARHKLLFAGDDTIADRLRALPRGSMRDTGQWHEVRLRGRCITALNEGRIGDREVQLPANMLRGCMSFVVEGIELGAPGAI